MHSAVKESLNSHPPAPPPLPHTIQDTSDPQPQITHQDQPDQLTQAEPAGRLRFICIRDKVNRYHCDSRPIGRFALGSLQYCSSSSVAQQRLYGTVRSVGGRA